MSYLIPFDYGQAINDVAIQQIVSGNEYYQASAEIRAIKEISSYVRQKYDVDREFTDTLPYNPQSIYKAGARVYKIADEQALLFYAKAPQLPFEAAKAYRTGDKVFYNHHTYTALQSSIRYGHEAQLQYGSTSEIPGRNIFPDDPVDGASYWHDEGAYEVPAGKINDPAYFTKGDNRDQLIVMYAVDIALYHLYARTAPKPIPDDRVDRYNAARSTLKGAMNGDILLSLPKRQEAKPFVRIRYGSNIKQTNSY